MSESKYLLFLTERSAKLLECLGGWWIKDIKVKKIEKELIQKFLDKIRHIPLFWAIFSEELKEVYEAIDEIRDYYQKEVMNKK